MLTSRFGKVRPLPNNGNGYGGFGYGGSRLYVVCLVDCFDPPRYVVRADTYEDAYYVAQECLSEEVTAEDVPADVWQAMLDGSGAGWLTISESGRVVSAEDDIRVDLWRGDHKRG